MNDTRLTCPYTFSFKKKKDAHFSPFRVKMLLRHFVLYSTESYPLGQSTLSVNINVQENNI